MCGIFAVYNDKKQKAFQTVFQGLKTLEYRGYDSWGIIAKKENGEILLYKKTGKLPPSVDKNYLLAKSRFALGHTRWATHGGISEKNSHPHFDCQKEIFVVHNGIIENFSQLKKALLKKNHQFTSETDTEVIAHLLEENLKNEKTLTPKILQSVFKKIKGLNAFIVFIPKINLVFAYKNSSPIVFGIDEKNQQFFLSSDYGGIISYTKKIYFLEDEEILIIKNKKFSLYDKDLKEKSIKFIKITQNQERLSLGKYPHFTLKEINEQPKIIENILTQEKEIKKLAAVIKKSYDNFFIGCGTAYYACLAGTYLFSKIAKRHASASIASEFSYLVDFLKKESLVIALSQSGETIDIISSIKKVKEKQAKVFALTNVLGSTLYRMSDYKMLLNAGPEKSVVATKSFTAKIAILILLAYTLKNDFNQGKISLEKAIDELKKVLTNSSKIKKIADLLKDHHHLFFLGRGLSYPLALESALKVKEISYIHAEGFPAGELKHGVIALIEKNTPVIVFNPEDETYEDTLSSAYEVKARGGYLIGLSSKKDQVYDQFIRIENCQEGNIIPYVAFSQLLAYYLTVLTKKDPDKPRNLAKSVTVK